MALVIEVNTPVDALLSVLAGSPCVIVCGDDTIRLWSDCVWTCESRRTSVLSFAHSMAEAARFLKAAKKAVPEGNWPGDREAASAAWAVQEMKDYILLG